jgi:prephenate dehydratase
VPCPNLEDVFDAVEGGKVDAGLIPVENTIEGSIAQTYDLLNERSLAIQGETIYRVVHCLIALQGVGFSDIRHVYSHPQALGQSRTYLAAHGYKPINYYDTAGAVKMIVERGLRDAAAVASRRAAEIYGMAVLAEGIETNTENWTRFLHIGRGHPPPTGRDKTSLTFTIDNRPGALTDAIRPLADCGLNITKLESRPLQGKPWEYVFFVDFEGHSDDPNPAEALRKLATHTTSIRVFGSYPRAQD